MLRPKLCIGMSLAPTWLSGEGWRASGSGIEGLYSTEFALDIARRAEAAHMDFVFRPDASFLPVPVMAQSFGFSSLDPTLMMAAIAHETRHIGLVTTISTTFGHPYTIARQLMSLHWMSRGRAGWNIVTALQGNANFGLPAMPSSQERYRRAAEFTEVVRRLWGSFPASALLVDRETGQYADPELLLPIDHQGPNFTVEGPLNIPEFSGPRIPLMQAGGSALGVDFAGQVADLVFGLTPDLPAALRMRKALTARAIAHRRQPRDVRLLPGLSLYLGDSRREAHELFVANHRRVDAAQRIRNVRDIIGLDLQDWPDDRRIRPEDLPEGFASTRGRQQADALRAIISDETPLPAALLARPEVLASMHWQVIGTPEDAAREIRRWFEAGAIDGFIAVPGGSRRSLDLTLNELLPRLVHDGIFRAGYGGETLASHLDE